MTPAPTIATALARTPVFDLAAELARLRAEGGPDWHQSGRQARTLLKEADLRVVLIALRPGARMEEHHAPGPITIQALEGALRVHVAGQAIDLPAGRLLALARHVPHDVEALEESALLLTIGMPDRRHVAPATQDE